MQYILKESAHGRYDFPTVIDAICLNDAVVARDAHGKIQTVMAGDYLVQTHDKTLFWPKSTVDTLYERHERGM